jgi:undecaprenyl-diphosphatase
MREQLSLFAKRLDPERSATFKNFILFFATLADASVLPLPTSTYFVLSASPDKKRVMRSVTIAVAGTVAGALIGYLIGVFAYNAGNHTIYDQSTSILWISGPMYDKVSALFLKWGAWILVFSAFSPLPYLVFSISSGIIGIDPSVFILATVAGQSTRFIFLGLLAKDFHTFLQFLLSAVRRSTYLKNLERTDTK